MTRRRLAEVAQGMALVRAKQYDDHCRVPVEITKNGVILRLILPDVPAETTQAIKNALARGGMPWLVFDRSGAVVHLYRNAVNGRGADLSMDQVLEALPPAADLPGDAVWTWKDFEKRQLAALLLLSDVTSGLTREQKAAMCGVSTVTLWRWEGQSKFLAAKRWLLERAEARLLEHFYANIGTGLQSADAQEKLAYTKMSGEVLQKIGRRQDEKAATAKSESDLATSLANLTPAVASQLAGELYVLANMLSGKGVVMADSEGNLTTKAQRHEEERAGQSPESRIQNPELADRDEDAMQKANCKVQNAECGAEGSRVEGLSVEGAEVSDE